MSQPIYVPTAKKMVHRRQKASPMPREPCCGAGAAGVWGCGRPEGGKGWGRLPWGQEEGDFLFQVFMSSQ